MSQKTILLDADVLIHFIKANEHLRLSAIFPKHNLVLLDVVYDELKKYRYTERQVDFLVNTGNIKQANFPNERIILREYARLKSEGNGDGESACMAVARHKKNIIASSNLKDIKDYCEEHSIIYLTTMDFLCEALRTGKMTIDEVNDFIMTVKSKRSKLPVNDIRDYNCVEKL